MINSKLSRKKSPARENNGMYLEYLEAMVFFFSAFEKRKIVVGQDNDFFDCPSFAGKAHGIGL